MGETWVVPVDCCSGYFEFAVVDAIVKDGDVLGSKTVGDCRLSGLEGYM